MEPISRCSFCGLTGPEVGPFVGQSGEALICSSCVIRCGELFKLSENQDMKEKKQEKWRFSLLKGRKKPHSKIVGSSMNEETFDEQDVPSEGFDAKHYQYILENIPTPKELKTFLDDYVVDQEEAKKYLCVAVYNHYKRLKANLYEDSGDGIELEKANVLMIGPTGTGKTHLARILAKKMNVPFAMTDATPLTQAGYVGEDVENILLRLIQNADYDIELAQQGIIYIDEIDKISKKGENVSITRDVSGEGVQQALLKIIEGTIASVSPQGGRKHPHQEMLKIDTKNILFICSGAFVGLDKIVLNRIKEFPIGFNRDIALNKKVQEAQVYTHLTSEDLIQFGLIPEFLGRLPVHVTLSSLDKDALVRILKEPKDSVLKQYAKILALDGVSLFIEEAAIALIAQKAVDNKTGARGLRGILERFLLDVTYHVPSEKNVGAVVITSKSIKAEEKVVLLKHKDKASSWEYPLYDPVQ